MSVQKTRMNLQKARKPYLEMLHSMRVFMSIKQEESTQAEVPILPIQKGKLKSKG